MARQTGSIGWFLQRLSGGLIFALILVHFSLMHYMGPEKRLYADVVRRFQNPLWKSFDLVFLTLCLCHGWYGVWEIVGDYVRSDSLKILALILIVIAAAGLFSIGLVTVLTF
ncbi:MAG: succinate dehydrogenase, hydrophobic membrane anchor protein [Candidatus Aureabacteria bacterium]|nr:succinate dehydrogenase, hydrophobic membrane anchor protein [Candidatus Auribacterota bacterium]